jgi:adenylate cyclase class IV
MAKLQSEITAEVFADKNTIYKLLEKQGFFFKEQLKMVDDYFTHIKITPYTQYIELATNSFLLREIVLKRRYVAGENSNLVFKRKMFDSEGRVIGEEKKTCEIQDTKSAKAVFLAAGLDNWCTKSITGHIFKKDTKELLIQEVEGLGFFIEVEEFEDQKGSNEHRIDELIEWTKNLGLPLGEDMHVKINYRLFLKRLKKRGAPRLFFGA